MIAASEWKAYNDAVAQISDTVQREVEEALLAWHAQHPDATVAETREYAKLLMDSKVQSYDNLASSFAAKWYDYQAERGGARLAQAITAAVYSPKTTDEVVRYQAKKLVAGDFAGFAKACGEYARNDSLRSLNQTVLANAKRDGKKGVRFARVASGRNTCAFCLMLCSRGAVYHSRKTAGEFSKFHRGCSCKVVPGFEDDPMAELVEGHDPNDALRQWRRVEDGRRGRTSVAKRALSASDYEAGFKAHWKEFVDSGKTESAYMNSVSRYIEGLVVDNPIHVEPFTPLRGKEIETAVKLAEAGHDVTLRNPDTHLEADGNTSDALVDGVTCDFKRIEAPKVKAMVRELTRKLDRQGPAFAVDLSGCEISFETAEGRLAALLDDPGIGTVYLLDGELLEVIKK